MARTLLALLLLTGRLSAAQAPAWQSARAVAVATLGPTGNSSVTAIAVDAAGNVYLAGSFVNSVVLGGTTLTCIGGPDVFVAKFNPISSQFVWAQRAGGMGSDYATALAVSDAGVYVAGTFSGSTASFGPTVLANAGFEDVFVAKLTDAGSTGSFAWAQRVGGTGYDYASVLVVSGTSMYMAGAFKGTTAGFGPITLTNTNSGTSDVFVAKLTDAGNTGGFAWAQRAGGTSDEVSSALAVSGTSVYMTGRFGSPTADFGPATLALTNSSTAYSTDVFVAKLNDAGNTGSFIWAQRAGGTGCDEASALAVSGTSVYVAGGFMSPTAAFGSINLTNSGSDDVFVAKLTDAGNTGSFVWAQQAGGMGNDIAYALAASRSSVYVAGCFGIPTGGFGSTTLTNAGSGRYTGDVFVAKLTDAGSSGGFAWAQRAGGTGDDIATSLAVTGTSIYVGGHFDGYTADFGATTLANPNANPNFIAKLGFLAALTDPTLTAPTAPTGPREVAALYPNPARRTATLRLPAGTTPAPLTLTDALGRAVRRYSAPAGPEAALDLGGLPAGLYLLRGAGPAQRLVVE